VGILERRLRELEKNAHRRVEARDDPWWDAFMSRLTDAELEELDSSPDEELGQRMDDLVDSQDEIMAREPTTKGSKNG